MLATILVCGAGVAGCAAAPEPAAASTPDRSRALWAQMREALGDAGDSGVHQTHGSLHLWVNTDARTADRIDRFVHALLEQIGPWFGTPDRPVQVFVFETQEALAPHLPAILGDAAPAQANMGRYDDGDRIVTCSMQWGLGWLGDLCLRALYAGDWRAPSPQPNRWFPVAMQSILYNCFRTPDGTFRGLNVASYYRPQAQLLKDEGRLIPLERFLRDDYDAATLVDDALRVQGREFLAWLLSQGKLRAFYAEYRRTCGDDPSGVQALERVLGRDIGALAAQWEAWLMAADGEIGDSEMAKPFPVLGILISRPAPGDNAGVATVYAVCPGGPAARDGIQAGDYIVSIDGTFTSSRERLLEILQAGAFGRTATLRVRRRGELQDVEVTLDRLIDG